MRLAGHPPAAGDDRRLVERRRLERAESQQQVRQRCLGLGGDWSWKRVLRLVLPCQSSTGRPSTRSRTRGRDDEDGKEDGKAARAWPAAVQLVSKLKVYLRSLLLLVNCTVCMFSVSKMGCCLSWEACRV